MKNKNLVLNTRTNILYLKDSNLLNTDEVSILSVDIILTTLPEIIRNPVGVKLLHEIALISCKKVVEALKPQKPLPVKDKPKFFITKELKDLLLMEVSALNLNTRPKNCLTALRVSKIYQIFEYTYEDLRKYRNFGEKTIGEIYDALQKFGISETLRDFFIDSIKKMSFTLLVDIPEVLEHDAYKEAARIAKDLEISDFNKIKLYNRDTTIFRGYNVVGLLEIKINFNKMLDNYFEKAIKELLSN